MNQEILELLAEKKYSAVKQLIGQMEEADLAKLFEELENEEDADQFNRLFRLLPKETAAEVFSYMEPEIQEKIVRTLTDTELQHILDDLFMDDYVDLVEEMPANVARDAEHHTGQPQAHQPVPKVPGGFCRKSDDQRVCLLPQWHYRGQGF